MHITSLKECILLWKLPLELVFEFECKLSRLLLRHLAVFFITFKILCGLMAEDLSFNNANAFHRC